MRELIRHILKENRLQQELKQFIEDNNIFDAAEMVGGLDNLKSIFKDDLEVSEILDELTGVVDFEMYYDGKFKSDKFVVFPIKYEIIGIGKNIWGTHSWPELNLIYDDSKLTSVEKNKLITIISVIQNDNTVGKLKTKSFDFGKSTYFDVTQINGNDVDIHDYDDSFSIEDVERIHDKLYGDSESLNESINSEIDKNLRAINILLSQVSWEGLCNIWVEYNPVDKDYEIRSKTMRKDYYLPYLPQNVVDEMITELNFIEESIKNMGLRPYVFSVSYVDNCEDEVEFMNESSNESEKDTKKLFKITKMIMEDMILPSYNHIICSYEITLNEVFNIPEVTVLFIGGYGTKLWPMTQGIRNMYIEVLDDISKEIANYTGVVIGVRGEQTPKCEDKENIYLRESENKSENKKLELVKEMIYSFFDEVEFIEVDTNYQGKPLIKIYHDVEDTAANYDNWLSHEVQDKIMEITGDGIILSPWWALGWDWKYKNVDFYINVQKIEYDDEGNIINESENKQERKFNKLIQNVEDYLNSNEYPSVKKFTVYYEDTHDDVIVNIFFNVEDSIRLGGGINSVIKRVGKQVMKDLEVFPMDFKYYIHFDRDINESEEKQPKYLNLIKDIVEPFKYEDCVCDIRVLYNEEDDMYLIDLNMGTEELNNKFIAVIGMTHYVKTLRLQITKSIKDYLPIDNFYVGSYASPNCKWKPLNESDNKEQSLQKLIDQYGLYEFIKMSGLDFNQVKSILNKMDNPKEILKQYIREYVLEYDGMSSENSGSLFGLKIRLSNAKLIYDIMVQDSDQIAFEIWEFYEDNYGQRITKDQYLTTINSLTNEELLSILSWMMETIQIGYWD
jgi:hypothetical protein